MILCRVIYWSLKTTVTYAIKFHNMTVMSIGPIKRQPIYLHLSSKYTDGYVEQVYSSINETRQEHWYYKSQTYMFHFI